MFDKRVEHLAGMTGLCFGFGFGVFFGWFLIGNAF